MQAFWLDRSSSIPVKLQFIAQVKYQIAAGLLYPGDQLPSLRDLAEGLSINLNTVVRAIDQLIEEGYLYSHQGRGIFVADTPPGDQPGAALRSLLLGTLAPAKEWGLSPEELGLALMAQAQLAKVPQSPNQRILLIGSSLADLRRIQRQLEASLPQVAILPRLPEEIGRPGPVALTLTTLFHAIQLNPSGGSEQQSSLSIQAAQATQATQRSHMPRTAQLQGRPTLPLATLGSKQITLAANEEIDQFRALQRLPQGSLLLLAAGDWIQAARLRQSLEASGLAHLRFCLITDAQPLEASLPLDQLDQAAFLLATQSGLPIAKEAQARRPDLPILIEPTQVSEATLDAIQQSMAAPPRTHRVQLRSAWV